MTPINKNFSRVLFIIIFSNILTSIGFGQITSQQVDHLVEDAMGQRMVVG